MKQTQNLWDSTLEIKPFLFTVTLMMNNVNVNGKIYINNSNLKLFCNYNDILQQNQNHDASGDPTNEIKECAFFFY